MSRAGAIFDALATLASGAAGITAAQIERGVRMPDTLTQDEFPRLFLYNAIEVASQIEHQQEETEWALSALLVTSYEDAATAQETTLALADAIRLQWRSDITLSGSVLWSYVSDAEMEESPQTRAKAVAITVAARTEEA